MSVYLKFITLVWFIKRIFHFKRKILCLVELSQRSNIYKFWLSQVKAVLVHFASDWCLICPDLSFSGDSWMRNRYQRNSISRPSVHTCIHTNSMNVVLLIHNFVPAASTLFLGLQWDTFPRPISILSDSKWSCPILSCGVTRDKYDVIIRTNSRRYRMIRIFYASLFG